jgi:predicted ATPase/Tfp pilus assembly protein PilF
VIDVPAETRTPSGVNGYVAQRRAVLVLDNLEQLSGADEVVERLLQSAPHLVVLATSRRPLRVTAEHEHPVPPLELPTDASMTQAETSGAVQLFVRYARLVRPGFRLTADNAADVIEVCRRLDGLPLALELAAARSKLLTPAALVARLDKALDIPARDRRTARQHTIRDTIAWSHDLLTSPRQAFFRRLAVFAGGADLDAVSTITGEAVSMADTFDVVAELVDDSLLTVGEDLHGEPRVGMLETVRAYALDQLELSGESAAVHQRHACYYLDVAEQTRPLLTGDRHIFGRGRFEAEHDNFRAALTWALSAQQDSHASGHDSVILALRLCGALSLFWHVGGYYDEARQWLQRATSRGRGLTHPAMARCQIELADSLRLSGDLTAAYDSAVEGVALCRSTNHHDDLSKGLAIQATIEMVRGHKNSAETLFRDAVEVARDRNEERLYQILGNYAWFLQSAQRNPQAAVQLFDEALELAARWGDGRGMVVFGHNRACALRDLGQFEDAEAQMRARIPDLLEMNELDWLITVAEDYATVLAQLRRYGEAVALLGTADVTRERLLLPRNAVQREDIAPSLELTRTGLTAAEWEAAYQCGRTTPIDSALSALTRRDAADT